MAYTLLKNPPATATGVLHTVALNGEKSIDIGVRDIGTSCTLVVEVSSDNTTWYPFTNVYRLESGLLVPQGWGITQRGTFFCNVSNFNRDFPNKVKYVRIRVAVYGSGVVDAEIDTAQPDIRTMALPLEPVRANTIAFLGDSITQAAIDQNGATSVSMCNRGPQHWVPFLTRQRVVTDQSLNFGIAGDTSTWAMRRLDDVIAARPRYCAVLVGTNDISNSVGIAQSKANLRTIWDKLLDAGIIVIGQPLTPRDMSGANQEYLVQLNQWVRGMNRYRPNFYVVDPYADIVDPTSATGAAKSGYYYDTTHPKSGAAYYVGKAIANLINLLEPDPGTSVFGISDAYSATNRTGNLLTNGTQAGTGGTLGTVTGVVADNWTSAIVSAPGLAVVGAKVARADGGAWQQFTGSGTVTGGAASFLTYTQAFGSFTNFSIGDQLEAKCEIEVDAGTANVSGFALLLRSTQNAVVQNYFDGFSIVSDTLPTEAFKGVYRTPAMPIAFTPTTLDVQFRVYVKQATAATPFVIRLGQFELRKV